jgi:hypothetical protein
MASRNRCSKLCLVRVKLLPSSPSTTCGVLLGVPIDAVTTVSSAAS